MAFNKRRVKLVRQRDAMQCGVACLCMVGNYWCINCSIASLESVCHATTEGVSLKGIMDGANSIGLDCKAAKLSLEQLKSCPLPAILHWNQNHFVVLHKINNKGTKFYVADPGKGYITYSEADFISHWVGTGNYGISLFFEKNNKKSCSNFNDNDILEHRNISFLMKYFKRYGKVLSIVLAALLLACIFQLIMPFLTQSIVDIGIRDKNIEFIWLILLGELMIVIGKTITDFIRRWLLLHVSIRVNISLVSDFFIKLLKLPMSFFDTKLMGDLLQRIGDHARVQNFLTGQVLNIVFTMLSFVVFGVVLLIFNPSIFIIFLIGSICYGIWIALFLRKRKVLDYEIFEQQAKNQNKTYQFITTIQETKLQDCEKRRRWEWEDVQTDLFSVQMKSLKLQQSQEAGSIFINEVKNILITIMAATAVINGRISLGSMLAIQYIVGQLNSPIEHLMQFIYSYQDVKISLERINDIHKKGNEDNDIRYIKEFNSKSSISINNLSFKYDPHSIKFTLKDVSFVIPEGKVTAIVGASGSGKTTLIKLILGYYNLKWWRRQCGVVMQDGVIFSESIAQNIAVGDGAIDDERLVNAAKIANIHEYIMGLPLKYDTMIGHDGMGLSQGQKQRILIARAVYKKSKFIFLDEATNSLDATNEKEILQKLSEFYKGRTVVIIAHRLSTVKNADQIIVLDKGRVVEIGNHNKLIEKGGVYYNLVKNQLELGD